MGKQTGFLFDKDEDRRCSHCGSRMLLKCDYSIPVHAIVNAEVYFSWFCMNPEHGEYKEFAGAYQPLSERQRLFEEWQKLQDAEHGE